MLDIPAVVLAPAGLVIGLVSAITPFVPVEAFLVSVGVTHPLPVALLTAGGAAVGQTIGKTLVFGSARAVGGSGWLHHLRARGTRAVEGVGPDRAHAQDPPSERRSATVVHHAVGSVGRLLRRANRAGLRLLAGRAGPLVVLVSSSVGLPPLLAVAFYAGASPMRRSTFVLACALGRAARFVVLVGAPGLLL